MALQDFLGLVQARVEQVPVFEDGLHFGDGQFEHHARDLGCVLHAHNLDHEVVDHRADLFLVTRVFRDYCRQNAVRCQHKLLINSQLFLSLILDLLRLFKSFSLTGECLLELGHLLHLLHLLHLVVAAHFGLHLRLLTLAKHCRQIVHQLVLIVRVIVVTLSILVVGVGQLVVPLVATILMLVAVVASALVVILS